MNGYDRYLSLTLYNLNKKFKQEVRIVQYFIYAIDHTLTTRKMYHTECKEKFVMGI